MTIIHMLFTRPAADGSLQPAGGSLTWTPTNSRAIAGTPDTVVAPVGFDVQLGAAQIDLPVAPTGSSWCWRIDEKIYGAPVRTIYVAVPDVAEVDYPDLVQVDPATLAPVANPEPAWWAALDAGLASVLSIGTVSTVPPAGQATASITGRQLNLGLVKGDPGGFSAATDLGTADLNTIVTPGLYRVTQGANVNVALNYPVTVNATAVMLVYAVSATNVVQRFEFTIGTLARRVEWHRTSSTGGATWTSWDAFARQRVDSTAGRVIYTFDDVNFRDQLIYGDTGRRDISSICSGTFSGGKLSIRRVGHTVDLYCVAYVPGVTGQFNMLESSLPVGFRPSNSRNFWGFQNSQPISVAVGFDGSTINMTTVGSSYLVSFSISYTTTDAWPTALPGVADGGMPAG